MPNLSEWQASGRSHRGRSASPEPGAAIVGSMPSARILRHDYGRPVALVDPTGVMPFERFALKDVCNGLKNKDNGYYVRRADFCPVAARTSLLCRSRMPLIIKTFFVKIACPVWK